MIDILLLVVVGLVAWLVSGEGAYGAGIVFLSVVLGGLLAMNFFEPLANFLSAQIPAYATYWDVVSLVGIFAIAVTLLRMGAEQLVPTEIELHATLYEPLRWGFAAAAGYVTMAILLTALHTAPLPREFMGFTPERKNLMQFAAPDRQWLGLTQYISEKSLSAGRVFDAPIYQAPGTDKSRIWSSFPIRYATRRERGGGMGGIPMMPMGGAASPGGTSVPSSGGL